MATKEKKMAEVTEKKNKNLSKVKDVTAGTVTFTTSDGKSVVATLAKIPAEIQRQLMVHGLAQKIGDAITSAQAEAKESGGNIAVTGIQTGTAEIEKLVRGVWAERTSTGGILALAISRMMKKPLEEVTAALAKLPEEADPKNPKAPSIEGYAARADVKAEIAAIKAERAKAKTKGNTEGALTL